MLSRSFACRGRRLALALLFVLGVPGAVVNAAEAETVPPQITLLAPVNGGTIVNPLPGVETNPTFKWRIDWPEAPTAQVLITMTLASDPALTQNVSLNNKMCPAATPSCWTEYSPPARYKGKYYWRVNIITPVAASSETWSFSGVNPPDRDADGVADAIDNCPAKKNTNQADEDRNHHGDVCDRDRTRPHVRALTGTATRGNVAVFRATVSDNYHSLRLSATLSYRGRLVLHGKFPFAGTEGNETIRFYSQSTLSRRLPAGSYRLCVTAWDQAGNQGRGCAAYRVR